MITAMRTAEERGSEMQDHERISLVHSLRVILREQCPPQDRKSDLAGHPRNLGSNKCGAPINVSGSKLEFPAEKL
jgi:hypothetical protein